MDNQNLSNKAEESPHNKDIPTVPLAYHETCMTRNATTLKWLIVGWVVSIIAAIGIFTYLWLQYDYVSTTEYSGVYNITDSEGNVVTSDLSPEDVIRILQELNNSNG